MMKDKDFCLSEAEKDGTLDEAGAKMTVAYMLMNQAFSLYDDSAELLRTHNLFDGQHGLLGARVYQEFDKFFEKNNIILTKEDAHNFAEDYDRIKKKIDDIVVNELEGMMTRKFCEICGKSKPLEDFSKSYKCRCKECVAKLQREKRKSRISDDVSGILLQLDRKKMQARQIYPNTVIVPYDLASKVAKRLCSYFDSKNNKKH